MASATTGDNWRPWRAEPAICIRFSDAPASSTAMASGSTLWWVCKSDSTSTSMPGRAAPSWLTTLRAFLSFSSVCMSGSRGSRRGVGQVLRLGDRALQDVQAAPKLVGADAQRRQEPDHIAVKARFHQDQAALVRGLHDMRGQVPGGLVTRWIAHHLERDHGAQPAHVANNAVAPRPGFEARAHADIPRPRRVVVPPHDLDRGQRRGAGQRIAAIGSAQSAHRGRVHQIRAPDQRRDRQAGAHGLGQGVRSACTPACWVANHSPLRQKPD